MDEKPKQEEASGPHVTSYNQSGGITAHTVHVSAPQPAVHGQVAFENEPHEGKYLTQTVIRLDAPYAASALQVEARGSSIESLDVRPNQPAGIVSVSSEATTSERALTVIHSPLAPEYIANVTTAQPDTLSVKALVGK